MAADTVPTGVHDETNAAILAVSEDRLTGFHERPFQAIAEGAGLDLDTVLERVRAMLEAGTIRRVRQTLQTTRLAPGALVAWSVPRDRLHAAFDWMHEQDPFTGHVVVRTTDAETAGAVYRLWTTLKVPQGYSMDAHCRLLTERVGADAFRRMPARALFTLGVGHVRRRRLEPGSRTEAPGAAQETTVTPLEDHEWRVIEALKPELARDEIAPDPWGRRAAQAGLDREAFFATARDLTERGVLGRFSTFLEHAKRLNDGTRVAKFNALFHWRVPEGQELTAGREVGRHHIMTHAYWREGGAEFANVNIMGVAHHTDKAHLLAHKEAIDRHLAEAGVEVDYTNVFWGGRSEIKPSEISPFAYRSWCAAMGVDPARMREGA
jgi:DNA-binding Lrp family transcriptional regulator